MLKARRANNRDAKDATGSRAADKRAERTNCDVIELKDWDVARGGCYFCGFAERSLPRQASRGLVELLITLFNCLLAQ